MLSAKSNGGVSYSPPKAQESALSLPDVHTYENGVQYVTARSLYRSLTSNANNFKRWSTDNIKNNKSAMQGIDYQRIMRRAENNRLIEDFDVALDFAKHLCMLTQTENAHKVRMYFIEAEKRYHTLLTERNQQVAIQLTALMGLLNEQNERIIGLERRIDKLHRDRVKYLKAKVADRKRVEIERRQQSQVKDLFDLYERYVRIEQIDGPLSIFSDLVDALKMHYGIDMYAYRGVKKANEHWFDLAGRYGFAGSLVGVLKMHMRKSRYL
ncbi:antA/AntB antirepressor family protein [Fibrisoma montanum]|nr:antA/AntB antirepressor family protein [Fibrisoma montanum]